MIEEILKKIHETQAALFNRLGFSKDGFPLIAATPPPEHKPEMLLIGCVDARLNPSSDIGIPDGKALIYRNIAALIAGKNDEIGNSTSAAATLEFAVKKMGVKKIVVMGHTHCGGIAACVSGDHETTEHIKHYLAPLEPARKKVANAGGNEEKQARAMEQAAVVQSMKNVMSYDVVQKAVAKGQVEIEGWVLDTGTKMIWEYDKDKGQFLPMGRPVERQIGA